MLKNRIVKIKRSSIVNILYCYIIAAINISIASYFEFIHFKLMPFYVPISWGILKDLADPILLILFPWNGWVFVIPLLFSILLRLSDRAILMLWLVTIVSMGTADTIISFNKLTISLLLRGIFFYLFVFGIFFSIWIFLKFFVLKGKNNE